MIARLTLLALAVSMLSLASDLASAQTAPVQTDPAISDSDRIASLEKRLAELEARPALNIHGSLEVKIYPSTVGLRLWDHIDRALPVVYPNDLKSTGLSSVTFSLDAGIAEDRVRVGLVANPLALPEAITTIGQSTGYGSWSGYRDRPAGVADYERIAALVALFNDWREEGAWAAADRSALLAALSGSSATDLVWTATDDIVLKAYGTPGSSVSASAFPMNTATEADLAKSYVAIQGSGFFAAAVDRSVASFLGRASAPAIRALSSAASLKAWLSTGLAPEAISELSIPDKLLLRKSANLVLAYDKACDPTVTLSASTSLKPSFITAASVSFPKIGGLFDLGIDLQGNHARAGSLNADMMDHQVESVPGYQRLSVSLAEGLIPGLGLGLSYWTDMRDATNGIVPEWYEILSVSQAKGPRVGAGASLSLASKPGEDMEAGMVAEAAGFDFLNITNWAFSVQPRLSASGAGLRGEFSLMPSKGILLADASLSWSRPGLEVSARILHARGTVSYNSDPDSVESATKNAPATGFSALGGQLTLNFHELLKGIVLLPLGVQAKGLYSIDSGAYYWEGGGEFYLSEDFKFYFGCGQDQVYNKGNKAVGLVGGARFQLTKSAEVNAKVLYGYDRSFASAMPAYSFGSTIRF
ncbi:MAG: hypothetical protein WCQ50_07000 [Spirochaetota bacterium]